MDKTEAKIIYDKMKRCQNRIFDTHYCEDNSCKGCDLYVAPELKEQAIAVLKGEGNETDN